MYPELLYWHLEHSNLPNLDDHDCGCWSRSNTATRYYRKTTGFSSSNCSLPVTLTDPLASGIRSPRVKPSHPCNRAETCSSLSVYFLFFFSSIFHFHRSEAWEGKHDSVCFEFFRGLQDLACICQITNYRYLITLLVAGRINVNLRP